MSLLGFASLSQQMMQQVVYLSVHVNLLVATCERWALYFPCVQSVGSEVVGGGEFEVIRHVAATGEADASFELDLGLLRGKCCHLEDTWTSPMSSKSGGWSIILWL